MTKRTLWRCLGLAALTALALIMIACSSESRSPRHTSIEKYEVLVRESDEARKADAEIKALQERIKRLEIEHTEKYGSNPANWPQPVYARFLVEQQKLREAIIEKVKTYNAHARTCNAISQKLDWKQFEKRENAPPREYPEYPVPLRR